MDFWTYDREGARKCRAFLLSVFTNPTGKERVLTHYVWLCSNEEIFWPDHFYVRSCHSRYCVCVLLSLGTLNNTSPSYVAQCLCVPACSAVYEQVLSMLAKDQGPLAGVERVWRSGDQG